MDKGVIYGKNNTSHLRQAFYHENASCNEATMDTKSSSASRDSLETKQDHVNMENGPKVSPDAPKSQAMAFTIDFGEAKSVDRQRIEDLMKKSQARHQRVQSLSRIDSSMIRTHDGNLLTQKPPMSAKLPRKSVGYNSEGYFSSDQEDSLLSIGGKPKIASPAQACDNTKSHSSAVVINYTNHKKSPTLTERMSESYHQGFTKPRLSKSPIVDSIMSRSDVLPSRQSLNLPLKHPYASLFTKITPMYNSMSYSYTDPSHDIISETIDQSPDGIMLTDISSPELDVLTPDNGVLSRRNSSVKISNISGSPVHSPDELSIKSPRKYEVSVKSPVLYDDIEKDDGHSSTISETGTYTIEGDNYTEEQKARMSIDKAFGIEHFEETVQEALRITESAERDPALVYDAPRISTDKNVLEISCCYESPTESTDPPHAIKSAKSTRNYLEKIKNKVRTISEKTFQRSTPKSVDNLEDVGSFTSVTTSGVFNHQTAAKTPKHDENVHLSTFSQFKRRNSLTKSQIDASEYVHHIQNNNSSDIDGKPTVYNSTVLRNVAEKMSATPVTKTPEHALVGKLSTMSLTRCHGDRSWIEEWADSATKYNKDDVIPDKETSRNNVMTNSVGLPPASPRNSVSFKGHHSPLPSPVKVASPTNSSKRHSDLYQGNLSGLQDTESFLLRTQDAISNLQARLHQTAVAVSTPPNPQDIRDRVLISRLPVSQLSRSNSLSYRVRRKESPQGSPLRSPLGGGLNDATPPHTSPKKPELRRLSLEGVGACGACDTPPSPHGRTAAPALSPSPRPAAAAIGSPVQRSTSFNQARGLDRCLSDDDDDQDSCNGGFCSDFDRGVARRTIAGGGARFNRAFELRRARLESPDLKDKHTVPSNSPRCLNTPENRRKFSGTVTTEHAMTNGPKTDSRRAPLKQANAVADSSRHKTHTGMTKSRSSTREFEPKMHERPKKKPVNVKEVEFTNWKKRSSYDPMKSALEGKKKVQVRSQPWDRHEDASSPSHSSPVHRSQSFHTASAVDQQYTSDDTEDEHLLVLVEPAGRTAMERAVQLKEPRGRTAEVIISRDYFADFHVNSKSTDRLGLRRENYRELRREDDPAESVIDKRRTFVVDSDTNSTANESSPRTSSVFSDSKMEDSSEFGQCAQVGDIRIQPVMFRPKNTQRSAQNKTNRHSGDFSTISSSTTSTNRDLSATSKKGKTPDIQPRYLDISKYKNETSPKNFLKRDPSKTYVGVLPHNHHTRDETRKGSAMCIEQEMKSKELEKWRRRASYDPRKSAAQSRSKTVPASSTVLRSQSFHGPVAGSTMTSPNWRPNDSATNDYCSSDNDF